jgi:hypothetical protein
LNLPNFRKVQIQHLEHRHDKCLKDGGIKIDCHILYGNQTFSFTEPNVNFISQTGDIEFFELPLGGSIDICIGH